MGVSELFGLTCIHSLQHESRGTQLNNIEFERFLLKHLACLGEPTASIDRKHHWQNIH